jgi:predicted kinase
MTHTPPTLHILCGKIAAGKSTLAARLGAAPNTVVLAEDALLPALFGPELHAVPDYIRYAARLRVAIAPHIVALLRLGVSVVLDFPANVPATRAWMRTLFEEAGVNHVLHYLDVPDAACRARLHARNAAGAHAFAVSDDEFDQITSYFVPPDPGEGFTIQVETYATP